MKYILFWGICLFSCLASANLDEFTIATEDKTCAIHYLTSKTKYNWTIKVPQKSCKEGWVDGLAEVQLYSPTKQLSETLSGFFSQGYWLDNFPSVGKIIERSSPEEKIQVLSFELGKDEEANITYIGQLRATQPEGRPYSAFQGCPDFRVLVVVPDTSIFENQAFQDKIVEQGLKYAHTHCAHPEILALFGAVSAQDPQIVFQMQVDCENKERTLIPVEENNSMDDDFPLELRMETADVLLKVDSEGDKTVVSYLPEKPHSSVAQIPASPSPVSILNHLQIQSKVSGKAEKGRVVVHIKKVLLDGTGITDLPDEISLLYFPGLKEGWAIVEGELQEKEMKVSAVQFCKKEWCTDVS